MRKRSPAPPSSLLGATARRHAQRVEFALVQLAQRIEASDGSAVALWRIRQCEAIVQASVQRAIASMMPSVAPPPAQFEPAAQREEEARAA